MCHFNRLGRSLLAKRCFTTQKRGALCTFLSTSLITSTNFPAVLPCSHPFLGDLVYFSSWFCLCFIPGQLFHRTPRSFPFLFTWVSRTTYFLFPHWNVVTIFSVITSAISNSFYPSNKLLLYHYGNNQIRN